MMSRIALPGAFLAVVAGACFGYGGFGLSIEPARFNGLDSVLTEMNHYWHGRDSFSYASPQLWVGGHGAGHIGRFTLGGGGAITARMVEADSLASEFGAVRADLEAGYPYAPIRFGWVRPYLSLSGVCWAHNVHSLEAGRFLGGSSPNFGWWRVAWDAGFLPGVELMGSFLTTKRSFVGVYAKAAYFLAILGPQWSGGGDSRFPDPPRYRIAGPLFEIGLRFGPASYRAYQM